MIVTNFAEKPPRKKPTPEMLQEMWEAICLYVDNPNTNSDKLAYVERLAAYAPREVGKALQQ